MPEVGGIYRCLCQQLVGFWFLAFWLYANQLVDLLTPPVRHSSTSVEEHQSTSLQLAICLAILWIILSMIWCLIEMPKEITPLNPLNIKTPRSNRSHNLHPPDSSAQRAQISTQGSCVGKVYNELGHKGGPVWGANASGCQRMCVSPLSDWKFKHADRDSRADILARFFLKYLCLEIA